jgi:hypothetical protein
MEEYIDKLKEYYESKSKNNKKRKMVKTVSLDTIEKNNYSYNKEFLKNLEDNILEEKDKMLQLKYNILYGLIEQDEQTIDLYDEIEKKIKDLKEDRDKIKLKIERKEERKKEEIMKIKEEIHSLMFSYKEVPEDRKEIYKEIEKKRDRINEILNKDRCIILKETNKIKIYTLTSDYRPILGNEIFVESYERGRARERERTGESQDSEDEQLHVESENLEE